MSLPINIDASKRRCSPIASSSVIWQGKDIDCLELCKGDSIDEVIHQLGCLLCTIKDQLDISTYDYTCLNLDNCSLPTTFRELMQIIIETLCQLKDGYLNGSVEGVSTTEQTVNVASCFQSGGITQTLSDYVLAIGQAVCDLQITQQNMQAALLQMQEEINILKG